MGKLKNIFFKIRYYLLLLLINLLLFIFTARFHLALIMEGYPGTISDPSGDAWYYYYMSISPFNPNIAAPFCYRILTPLIIYLLPINSITGYWIFTVICTVLTSFILFHFLKKLGFNNIYSYCGSMLFIISIANFFLFYFTIFVDPLLYLLFTLGCLIILYIDLEKIKGLKEVFLISLILTLGIMNKENIILLIPMYAMITKGHKGYKFVKTIVVSIPPIITFILLRRFIPSSAVSFEQLCIIFHLENWPKSLFAIIITFSLLWFPSLINIYRGKINAKYNRFLKYSTLMIPVFALQIALATDIYRNVFLGFPIIIPAALGIVFSIEKSIFKFNNEGHKHDSNLPGSNLLLWIILFFQASIAILYFLQWELVVNLYLEFMRPYYFGVIFIGILFSLYLSIKYFFLNKQNSL